MSKIIYPGTFDPPTLGHYDIIQRGVKIFSKVIVAVGQNRKKETCLFSPEERVELLKALTKDIPNIEVVSFSGLLVDYAEQNGLKIVLRSIRTTTDFEYETVQAEMNRQLGDLETFYLVVNEKYRLISSSLVKEIAGYGKRLHRFIPKQIEEKVFTRLASS